MFDQLLYRDKDVFFQRVHPAAGILYLAVLFTLALLFDHPLYLLVVLAVATVAIFVSDAVDKWELYLTIGLWMAVLILIVNPLLPHSANTVLWEGPVLPLLGRLSISLEAIVYGAVMGVRLLAILTVFALYNAVIDPDKATNLMARIARKSALVISISTRMLPGVARDLAAAREVQQMRGVDFSTGSIKDKMRKYSWLLDCILLSSLEGALQTAEAMQARGFGSGPRSCYRRDLVRPRDYLITASSLITLTLAILAKAYGYSNFNYYPALSNLAAGPTPVIWLSLITAGLLIPVITAWGWNHWHYLKSKI